MAHKDGVAAVDRAIALLEAFDADGAELTLAELAARTGFVKSTVLRLAASLERGRLLDRSPDGRYRLGPTTARLGTRYRASFRLGDRAMPILEALSHATGESASLYVRAGDRRVCLHRVHSLQHQLLHFVEVGTQFPFDTGASGRVIAAYTEPDGDAEVRRRGVARSIRDRTIFQTAAVAAPVFGADGAFVGALSLAGPAIRFTEEALPRLEEQVVRAAQELTRSLGGSASATDGERTVA